MQVHPESNGVSSRKAVVSAPAELSDRDRKIVRISLTTLAVLSIGTWIGVASSPYLVNNYPLVLIGMSPLSRHMILVAPLVGAPMVLLVGGLRTLAFTAFAYFLGRALGEPALVWIEERGQKTGRFVRWLERFIHRWSYLAVFIFPLGLMACVAGVTRMPPRGFFLTAFAGIMFRLSLYIVLADSIRAPIMSFLEFIRIYQIPATIAVAVGIGAYQIYKHRRAGFDAK